MLPLWNLFLKKREFTVVLVIALIVGGVYCAILIPKEASPAVNIPVGSVTTTFPGASAKDVEKLITDPLEEQIINIGNIDTLTSTSVDGRSSIRVQFDANADLNQSMQDLRDAVSKVQLPSDANTPSVSHVNFSDRPILTISIAGDLPQTEFADLGQTLTNQLENVIGVSSVDVAGIPQREVDVVLNKSALSAHGLDLNQVISAIAASNASLPAGTITMSGVNYNIDFQGSIATPDQIGDIAVTNRDGATVYLKDVGLIADGLAPNTTYSRTSVAGAPANQAMTLLVYEQAGSNVTQVADGVKARLKSLQSTSLSGLTVLVAPSTDQGVQVSEQLGKLVRTGLETVFLVIAILFLTIGWRESLVAALSIPLSFLIAFIGLYVSNYTLNLISLFALILAVGILVDSGIVVTEAIHARIPIYGNALEAAHASLKEYAWPLIAGTATTIAVFIPLMYLTGSTGRFIAGIPFTIIIVLCASIFVALGVVPLIAVSFTTTERNSLEKKQEEYTEKVKAWYIKHLRAFLENRRAQNIFFMVLGVAFAAALALPLTSLMQTEFFPQANQDYLYVNIQKAPGTSLDQTDLAAREVEELLYTDPDIASFTTTVGASSALNGSSNSSSASNYGNITINLQPGHTKTSTQVQTELTKLLSPVRDATVQVLQPTSGPGGGSPIQIQFTGSNLDELTAAADSASQLLATVPGASNITTTTKNNGTEFVFNVDRAKATAYGVTAVQIAQTLRAAVNGTTATTINEPLQNVNVVVKVNLNTNYTQPSNTAYTTPDTLLNLPIKTPNGLVLLGSILTSSLGTSNASIAHLNEQRIQTVSAYPSGKATASSVVNAFKAKVPELHLPADVTISYGGDSQSINQSFQQIFLCLLAGFFMMFMILILTFDSLRNTLQLLLIIPLSLIGVFFGLFVSGQTLSFPVLLGFVALGGVIVNHAIILTDSMIHLSQEHERTSRIEIALEAASHRLRPIFLTTVTTAIGMIPLAAEGGQFAPLAFTVMYGLTFAILLTLVLIPTLFSRTKKTDI